jgi:hypothetical protein
MHVMPKRNPHVGESVSSHIAEMYERDEAFRAGMDKLRLARRLRKSRRRPLGKQSGKGSGKAKVRRKPRARGRTFRKFMEEVVQEARREGRKAVTELKALRAYFRAIREALQRRLAALPKAKRVAKPKKKRATRRRHPSQ